jgi:uncharacterized protein
MRLPRTPRAAIPALLGRKAWLRVRGLGFRQRAAASIVPAELRRVDVAWSVTIGLAFVDTMRSAETQSRHILLALRSGEPYRVARPGRRRGGPGPSHRGRCLGGRAARPPLPGAGPRDLPRSVGIALTCPVAMIRILSHVADVARAEWDALVDDAATPFVSHAFLDALESSGSATPKRGWTARHLTLWQDGRLVAAAPAYVKHDLDGADFARDFGFGRALYPKLVIGVPITPVTGRRMLIAPGADRAASIRALIDGARELCREERLSGVQVLFPDERDATDLEAVGLHRRMDFQAHWKNRGYPDVAAWAASLDSKRRHQWKRETSFPAKQGIAIRTVRGAEIAADRAGWGRAVAKLFESTLSKMGWWGGRRLNDAFFLRVFRDLPQHCEVVEARRDGELIAGAWNVSSSTHLFGRYWGCFEEHPFLHFNVCLYHSIDDCIRRGLSVFEGGAGGQHKIFKGFDLAPTYSMHVYLDPRLDDTLGRYFATECAQRRLELESFELRRAR